MSTFTCARVHVWSRLWHHYAPVCVCVFVCLFSPVFWLMSVGKCGGLGLKCSLLYGRRDVSGCIPWDCCTTDTLLDCWKRHKDGEILALKLQRKQKYHSCMEWNCVWLKSRLQRFQGKSNTSVAFWLSVYTTTDLAFSENWALRKRVQGFKSVRVLKRPILCHSVYRTKYKMLSKGTWTLKVAVNWHAWVGRS